MSVLVCTLQGRFGNQVMQYLFCRALAERHALELRMDQWIGESVFQISHPRPGIGQRELDELPRINELTFASGEFERWVVHGQLVNERHATKAVIFRGYAQMQQCMIYSKRDAQRWLKLRPEIETACANAVLASAEAKDAKVVCHRRRGDYAGYGYPIVSTLSYLNACDRFGLCAAPLMLGEESPIPHGGSLPDDLSFMPDFYRMMTAPTLLRGNSSFSWLAGLLGDGIVLSPIVDGLEGGKEHDCAFVAGNWPKFTGMLDFVTDLHVSEK